MNDGSFEGEREVKITILEDRPWIVRKMAKKISEIEGVSEITWVFYYNGEENEAAKVMQKYFPNDTVWRQVNDIKFEATMNELFEEDQRLFFFDLALNDKAEYFEERINVKYAQKRFREGDKRIWFYTTSDAFNINKINKQFEGHNIPVTDYLLQENQLVFDMKLVKKIIENANIH